jgi:uncharacterized protein (TIGR02145 family)
MKKSLCFSTLFICFGSLLPAQDYKISFAGEGAAMVVETVYVENQTQGTSLTLNGSDVLHLVAAIGIPATEASVRGLSVSYSIEGSDAFVSFFNPVPGPVTLSLYDIQGKSAIIRDFKLDQGLHTFAVNCPLSGIYTMIVQVPGNILSGKICATNMRRNASIRHVESPRNNQLKSPSNLVQMQYNDGEILMFLVKTEHYSTISSMIPTGSTTLTTTFIEARDLNSYDYTVVKIGEQFWLSENLKSTFYNNGEGIPMVVDNTDWLGLTTGACCYYEFVSNNHLTYGMMYNWHAIATDNICPPGWHVPTENEWLTLSDYLGEMSQAGGKMKEAGLEHWSSPNTGASNSSGFTALPGGYRDGTLNGGFYNLGTFAYFWASTAINASNAYVHILFHDEGSMYRTTMNKNMAFSVRCIKN